MVCLAHQQCVSFFFFSQVVFPLTTIPCDSVAMPPTRHVSLATIPCLCLLVLHLCCPLFLLFLSSFVAFQVPIRLASGPAADVTWFTCLRWPLLQPCATSIAVSPSRTSSSTPCQPALARVCALLGTHGTVYRTIF